MAAETAEAHHLYDACCAVLNRIDAIGDVETLRYPVLLERRPAAEGPNVSTVSAQDVVLGHAEAPAPGAAAADLGPFAPGGLFGHLAVPEDMSLRLAARAPPVPCLVRLEPELLSTVVVVAATRRAADVLAELRFEVSLEPVDDLFNDKLDYSSCSSFADVRHLLHAMRPLVDKFAYLDMSKVGHIMAKFVRNFARLLTALEHALAQVQPPVSQAMEIAARLDAISELMREAAALGAVFYRKERADYACPACGRVGCPTTVCSCGTLDPARTDVD